MANTLSECHSTWHGYTCGLKGKHTWHQEWKNQRVVAVWSDDVARNVVTTSSKGKKPT